MATLQSYAGLDLYQLGREYNETNQVRGDSMEFWLKPLSFGNNFPPISTVTITEPAVSDDELLTVSVTSALKLYRKDVLWFASSSRLVVIKADTILGTSGSGATATASLTSTAVSSITVTNGGANYGAVPTISFTGGSGSGAAATAVLTNGVLTAINVTNGGTGYSGTPTVVITPVANTSLPVLPVSGSISDNDTATTYALRPYLSFSEGGVVDTQGQEMTSRNKGQSLFQSKGISMRNANITLNGTLIKDDQVAVDLETYSLGSQLLFWQSRHAAYQRFNVDSPLALGMGPAARQGVAFVQNHQPSSPDMDFLKVNCTLSVSGAHVPYRPLGY